MAIAPIGPLAWELPCTMGVALKRPKKKSANQMLSWTLFYSLHFDVVYICLIVITFFFNLTNKISPVEHGIETLVKGP